MALRPRKTLLQHNGCRGTVSYNPARIAHPFRWHFPGGFAPNHVPGRVTKEPIPFLSPIDRTEIDRVLRASLDSDVALIGQIAEYIIGNGGKRLRPALVLLASRACGYAGSDHYLLGAVMRSSST